MPQRHNDTRTARSALVFWVRTIGCGDGCPPGTPTEFRLVLFSCLYTRYLCRLLLRVFIIAGYVPWQVDLHR